jgi:carbonic anhydrase
MLFRLATLAAILANSFTAYAADGSYNYDETHIWDQVITKSPNECAGTMNSPIAITDTECTDFHTYVMDNGTCNFTHMKATVEKNGVKIGIAPGADCTPPHFILPGTSDKYTWAQMHIHLSSEHTIDGEYYAAELHMVHVGPTRFSVIGMMLQPDKPDDNAVFGPFIDSWKDARYALEASCPATAESCKIKNKYAKGGNLEYPESNNMHPYNLLETGSFYHYFGGLTTPPCTQAVHWNLATKPAKISVRQFADMAEIILKTLDPKTNCSKKLTVASESGSTSRPPQAINGRTIKKICPANGQSDTTVGGGGGTTVGEGNSQGDGEASSATVTSYTVGALSFAAAMAAGQIL